MQRLFFLLLLLPSVAFAQNLVPNPSFEDTLDCPTGYPDLEGVCEHWHSYSGTCDYMNNCSAICGYYNQFGFQEPHSGEAYSGLATYLITVESLREHLGIELTGPLQIGTTYYLSFFVSTAWNNLLTNIATNNIGALLTTYDYYDPELLLPLPNFATINETEIISDTLQWTKISGSFVADSSYTNLVIGNFFDDALTDTTVLPFQIVPQGAYYYIDDVCLSTDSLYCTNWTSTDSFESNNAGIRLFPNPSLDAVNIYAKTELQHIQIYNCLGYIVVKRDFKNQNQVILKLDHLCAGFYIVSVETKDGRYNQLLQIE